MLTTEGFSNNLNKLSFFCRINYNYKYVWFPEQIVALNEILTGLENFVGNIRQFKKQKQKQKQHIQGFTKKTFGA